MVSQEVMESVEVSNGSFTSCSNGLKQVGSVVKENENLGDNLLEDLDSYMQDIKDRLMISRMVSDSVIKGIVNAVEQEAAEKVAAKELEVIDLKELLKILNVGTDRMRESLASLRNVAKDQFKKLKKEIGGIRGCIPIRRINSGPELVGLSRVLKERETESRVGVDGSVDALKRTVDTIFTQLDDMLVFSKASLCELQQEQEFQREVEALVMQSAIRSIQEEFEKKLWDQNTQSCGVQSMNWLEKFNEVSSLCKELDEILKSLATFEAGQLLSHGSHDMDHLHLKALGEGNGKLKESERDVPESFDAAQLKHLSKDELVTYFNTMMTKMRRNHDSAMHEQTEKYYRLKREYLNMRDGGFSLPLKKDKEFDILKKKIPEVILKLDDILVENEKLPSFSDGVENLGSLKDRLDSLLSENCQLRDSLTDKNNEIKWLFSQVSAAADRTFLTEANLRKLIQDLDLAVEDMHIEASVSEEVYRCVLRELIGQIKCDPEADHNAKSTSKLEIEDSGIELLFVQELWGFMFGEAMKDVEGKLKHMYEEQLKQELILLEKSVKEEEKLTMKVSATLMKQGEQLQLASCELKNLTDYASLQKTKISESSKELDLLKCQLVQASEQNKVDNVEIEYLNEKLDEQRKTVLSLSQEKQSYLFSIETKEKELRKQMETINVLVTGLSKRLADFEWRVSKDIEKNNSRLPRLKSQLSCLIKQACVLRSTGLTYKQRLGKRDSDLQTAEAEVDLLGDQVDTLLSLLEKIYIALDHYSPILQHYPGIIEILKLVRRELSGESIKPI